MNRFRKSLNTSLPSSKSGPGEPEGAERPYHWSLEPEPFANIDTPSSCMAVRLTSAKRTRSITWFEATPSCCFSMLTTSSFFAT